MLTRAAALVHASVPALSSLAIFTLWCKLQCALIRCNVGWNNVTMPVKWGKLYEPSWMIACRNPALMNPRGSRQVGPGATTMMAYPMQRMSAFQQQGSQPQFFGLCLRVRFQSLLHAALGHPCDILYIKLRDVLSAKCSCCGLCSSCGCCDSTVTQHSDTAIGYKPAMKQRCKQTAFDLLCDHTVMPVPWHTAGLSRVAAL